MEKLIEMLGYCRPHESDMESAFVKKYLVEPFVGKCIFFGPMRNVCIIVGESDTLFSCHTDTVHFKSGFQNVIFDQDFMWARKSDGECLGADDTTGVWLMLEMIRANVPGTYLFHRGEERGGIGSVWMQKNMATWLKKFKRAVAFDRKGETSVITKQRGRTCCSDEFAKALCDALGSEWKPDPTGTFTDTANYTALIPECTNLSIGYYDQHTPNEMQNVAFALELRDQLIKLDWEKLPTVREAKEETYTYTPGYYGSRHNFGGSWGGYGGLDDWDDDIAEFRNRRNAANAVPRQGNLFNLPTKPGSVEQPPIVPLDYDNLDNEELGELDMQVLKAICENDSVFAAMKIQELLSDLAKAEKAVGELDDDFVAERRFADDCEKEIERLTARIKLLERKPNPVMSLLRRSVRRTTSLARR